MMRSIIRAVADRHIPFLESIDTPGLDLRLKDGEAIRREDLLDADALIVRTRTRCDRELLEGTPVRFIATATIGTDHIDLPWCESHGISVCSAAGCNAGGVMQYVLTALYEVCSAKRICLKNKTIGIIGVGQVGGRVEQAARLLGFEVLLCDPPRAAKEGSGDFVDMEELLRRSDIVTLHTPLDETTAGMAGRRFFEAMRPGAIFINASRGEVVDENALLAARDRLGALIIDTWASEPEINVALLQAADMATPHIAGYSLPGKINGTEMSVHSLAEYFNIPSLMDFRVKVNENDVTHTIMARSLSQDELTSRLLDIYDIRVEDSLLRRSPESFEAIRRDYVLRKEIKFI